MEGYDERLEGCDQKCYATLNAWKMMHILGYLLGYRECRSLYH